MRRNGTGRGRVTGTDGTLNHLVPIPFSSLPYRRSLAGGEDQDVGGPVVFQTLVAEEKTGSVVSYRDAMLIWAVASQSQFEVILGVTVTPTPWEFRDMT